MTKVFAHELPVQARALMDRLHRVLREASGEQAALLLARARIEDRDRPRMVLTGQYSSGKSSLIKALTDGAVDPRIDADIATDAVEPYDWGSVVLVDTPGVQSGLRTHDELALGAIGEADFVLFVITVNLFDDASRDYLQRLANELRLFGQMIVVITETGKQAAADGVRERAVQEALGTSTFNLPIAEVDSVYYLRSLEAGPRSELLRARSGIDELRVLINRISQDSGELAQLRQPLHLIRQLCDEGQPLFVDDETSHSALVLLAAQRAAVLERRNMIGTSLSIAESRFTSSCLVDVKGFVDTVTSLPADDDAAARAEKDAERRLVEALERHASRLAESVNQLTTAQLGTLSTQLLEITESNRAQRLLRLDREVELTTPEAVAGGPARQTSDSKSSPGMNWRLAAEQLKRGQAWWGAGNGLRDASGSNGHRIVLDVGHTFGQKFKPWQAIKIADKIGKAAKVGGFVLQIGMAGYEVVSDMRKARAAQLESERQHSAFVTEIMGHADKIAAEAREQLWAILDPPINEFLAEIQKAQEELLGSDQQRDSASRELRAIATEADHLLAISAG